MKVKLNRVLSIFILIAFFSCNYFTNKSEDDSALDTIIDFSKVDKSPSFKDCESSSSTDSETTECFGELLQLETLKGLRDFSDTVTVALDETVMVTLLISKEGKVTIKKIEVPEIVCKQIPELKTHIKLAIRELPDLSPATKRGIPVTTQYTMPIHIKTKK